MSILVNGGYSRHASGLLLWESGGAGWGGRGGGVPYQAYEPFAGGTGRVEYMV